MTTSVGSGIGSSLGVAKETTWGTWVTPAKWTEYESESIQWIPKRIVGSGLANGLQVQRATTRQQVSATVQGDIKTPIYYKGMGLYLGSLMGSLGVAPVQQGATAAYLQTHALADAYGQSLSFQQGIPDLAGTIHQYNYNGCKVTDAVFECAQDDYLRATFSVDGKDYDTSNTYATPSYQAGNTIFAFNQANFKMGTFGAEATIEGVRKCTVTMKRPYKVDNFYQDATGRKQQQVQNGFFMITVEIESDYITDAAFVAQFNADTAQSLIWDFNGPIIASTFHYDFQIQIPNLNWDAGQPDVSGPDIVQPKLKLVGLYDGTHTPATILYTSTDTTL